MKGKHLLDHLMGRRTVVSEEKQKSSIECGSCSWAKREQTEMSLDVPTFIRKGRVLSITR